MDKPVRSSGSAPGIADLATLSAQLEAIAEREPDDLKRRSAVLAVLREALAQGRDAMRAKLEAGAAGLVVGRGLAAATDVVVTALWDYA